MRMPPGRPPGWGVGHVSPSGAPPHDAQSLCLGAAQQLALAVPG
eukprot:CAMPEP_0171063480 /NCGR_PEP_ID=MMETSP0766_2-20121228/5689_1 /TAXON_ID=439317 /ORGANISM="Gambierdiscus australes, Strain CAWD 149" /LENGTH=43 /DNA_ID= /DNA_START= /DNA_END= /DNA_ORIENTATION=